MKINYSSGDTIIFSGYKWSKRPSNYIFVDLRGSLDSGILTGDVFIGQDSPRDIGRKIGVFVVKKTKN